MTSADFKCVGRVARYALLPRKNSSAFCRLSSFDDRRQVGIDGIMQNVDNIQVFHCSLAFPVFMPAILMLFSPAARCKLRPAANRRQLTEDGYGLRAVAVATDGSLSKPEPAKRESGVGEEVDDRRRRMTILCAPKLTDN